MRFAESMENTGDGKKVPIQFDQCHVYLTTAVHSLAPQRSAVPVKGNQEADSLCNIICRCMKFDLQ
ncbi:hypothetical protein GCM10009077_32120 [Roseibium denhamense]